MSLTIEDGESMVLLGPSGCGKSTTLRARSGERLGIHFDLAQAHLFDPVSTRVVPRRR